jgi:hypothetical protein
MKRSETTARQDEKIHSQWANESAYWPDDAASGAMTLQLTGNVSIATNIYNEDPACSPENRIAVVRSAYASASAPAELWVVDLATSRSVPVDTEMSWQGACPQAYGNLFFYPRRCRDRWELRRLRFSTLEIETIWEFESDEFPFRALGSASPDGRLLTNLRRGEQDVSEVIVFDIENGASRIIAAGAEFFNPHPRFDRRRGEQVLVQQNRGMLWNSQDGARTVDATLGATLVLANLTDGTTASLPISRPAIPHGVSGHEAWVTGEAAFLYSLSPVDPAFDDGRRRGNLLLYRLGEELPRVVADAPDLYFGHVSTSACGRFWCCDAWHWPHDGTDCCRVAPRLTVGSLATGRFAFVGDVGGPWPRYENGHSHPYLSADNTRVVFTSARAGLPQVFSATLPAGLLAGLDD